MGVSVTMFVLASLATRGAAVNALSPNGFGDHAPGLKAGAHKHDDTPKAAVAKHPPVRATSEAAAGNMSMSGNTGRPPGAGQNKSAPVPIAVKPQNAKHESTVPANLKRDDSFNSSTNGHAEHTAVVAGHAAPQAKGKALANSQKAAAPVAAKGAATPGAKEPAKLGAKEAAKPGAKEAAKPGAKEAAKPGAKEAAKPAAIEAAKPVAIESAKPAALEAAKPGAKKDAKPAAKEDAKPGAKQAAKPGASEAAKPAAIEAAKPVSIEAAKAGAKEDTKLDAKEAAKPGVIEAAKPGVIEAAKLVATEAAKAGAKGKVAGDAKRDVHGQEPEEMDKRILEPLRQVTGKGVPKLSHARGGVQRTSQTLEVESFVKARRSTGETSGLCVLAALPLLKVSQMVILSATNRFESVRSGEELVNELSEKPVINSPRRPQNANHAMRVLLAIFVWVCMMAAIQHHVITLPLLNEEQSLYFPIVATFLAGYLVIVLEEQTEINKAATALVLGVLVWVFIGTGLPLPKDEFTEDVNDTLKEVSSIVFFLLGALTIVEIIDSHKGFDLITQGITATRKRNFLLIIGMLTFVLSCVMDNLTVVIVMVSLVQKIVVEDEYRLKLGGIIVVCANAGGAWTPIGDITTTMLYIGGQVTAPPLLFNLFLPSCACVIGALSFEFFRIDGTAEFRRPPASSNEKGMYADAPQGQVLIFLTGLLGLISVPVFVSFTSCPPWTAIMLILGILGIITSLCNDRHDEQYSLKGALSRVEVPDTLFFLGVLFAVGGLERVGLLKAFAIKLDSMVADESWVAIGLGVSSAVVDNVPLVAATQGMYDLGEFPANDKLWNLITFCAGCGGSMLVIGSAAGVAFMGMERNVSFGWYVRSISPAAIIGYTCGVTGILMQEFVGLTAK